MAGLFDAQDAATITNYARGAWDGVCQQNPLFAHLKAKGKIEYDVTGKNISGPVEAGRHTVQPTTPGQDLSDLFVPRKRHATWTFEWAEIGGGFSIDRGLLRRNGGAQSLVDLKKTEIVALIRDLIDGDNGLAHQMLQMDGVGYSGDGDPFLGLPSFLHAPGSTGLVGFDGVSTATGIAPADTDKEVTFSSTSATYGGLSMERGALDATIDNLEDDAWTPTLVNADYDWGSGSTEDPDGNILLFLQHQVNRASRFSSRKKEYRPSEGWLDRVFFGYLGDKLASKQTINVQSGQDSVQTPNLGYAQDKLRHAGLTWNWDENMPSETSYTACYDQMMLKFQKLYKDLMEASPLTVSGENAGIIEMEIKQDIFRRGWLVWGTIPGQVICHPRYFTRASRYS